METILLKEEKELLIAAYKTKLGELFYPISTIRSGNWIQIGGVDFPDDPENCDPDIIAAYREAFESLCDDGHIKHDIGLRYILTRSGKELAKELAKEYYINNQGRLDKRDVEN